MPPYITYPKEISNFHTLNWFIKQLYHPSLDFHTLNQFFKQLIDFSVIITQYITYSIELIEGAQPHSHPNSKNASSPLWMATHQQCLIFSGVYSIISDKSVKWARLLQQIPECTVNGVVAIRAQPSDWAQPHRHPNWNNASSPLWMTMHQQLLIFSGGLLYYFI